MNQFCIQKFRIQKFHFQRSQLCIPYGLFLVCFVLAPLVVIIYYAFTNGEGKPTLENLTGFFSSPNTIGTLVYSLGIAVSTTCVCLLLAYPIAYILARSKMKHKSVVLMIFVMPMWINFTLRITALKEILTVLEGNLAYHPFLNTLIGMTYDFLPFMILPIYTTLLKLDNSLLEAAADLGADTVQTFMTIMERPEALEVSSAFLDLFGITHMVVTGFSAKQMTHSNRQVIEITALSDTEYVIESNDY